MKLPHGIKRNGKLELCGLKGGWGAGSLVEEEAEEIEKSQTMDQFL